MRQARVLMHNIFAGILEELPTGKYSFHYQANYQGPPISLTLPIKKEKYEFSQFPAFFEGLLPEGTQLEALLRKYKLDQSDYLGQLLRVGNDVVGAVSIEEIK